MIYYQYFEKAKCSCGYSWTTSETDFVKCKCGKIEIKGRFLTGMCMETNEEEFKNFVAEELKEEVSNITIIKL